MSKTTHKEDTPEDIQELLHYSFINTLTESDMPLWYLMLSFEIRRDREVAQIFNPDNNQDLGLPF
jgi:hypothetical protein